MPSSWETKNAQFVEVRGKLLFLIHNVLSVMEQENIQRLLIAIWNHISVNAYFLTGLPVLYVERDVIMTLQTNPKSWLVLFRKSVEVHSSCHVHQNQICSKSIGLIACTLIAQSWLHLSWVQSLSRFYTLEAWMELLLSGIRYSDLDKTLVWYCLAPLKSGSQSLQLLSVLECIHAWGMGSFFRLGAGMLECFSSQSLDIPFQSRPMPKRRACFL